MAEALNDLVATDRDGSRVQLQPRRNFPQPEVPRLLYQITGKRAGMLFKKSREHQFVKR